jgi:hypothetical protein
MVAGPSGFMTDNYICPSPTGPPFVAEWIQNMASNNSYIAVCIFKNEFKAINQQLAFSLTPFEFRI